MSRLLLGTPGFALIVAIQVELFPPDILVHSRTLRIVLELVLWLN